jgi:hypothetical protein
LLHKTISILLIECKNKLFISKHKIKSRILHISLINGVN